MEILVFFLEKHLAHMHKEAYLSLCIIALCVIGTAWKQLKCLTEVKTKNKNKVYLPTITMKQFKQGYV